MAAPSCSAATTPPLPRSARSSSRWCASTRALPAIIEHRANVAHPVDQPLVLVLSRPRLPTSQIVAHGAALVRSAYGNYVVQYIIEQGSSAVSTKLMSVLCGSVAALAQHKYAHVFALSHARAPPRRLRSSPFIFRRFRPRVPFPVSRFLYTIACHTLRTRYASNVLETCLRKSSMEVKHSLIEELCAPASFVSIVDHKIGNYVVQRAIAVASPEQRVSLVALANENAAQLKRSNVGKRVYKLLHSLRAVAPKDAPEKSSEKPQQTRTQTTRRKKSRAPRNGIRESQTNGAHKQDASEKDAKEYSGWDP